MTDRPRNPYPQTQRPNRGTRFWVAAWIGLIGALGGWHWSLERRNDAAAAELSAVEARWRTAAMQLQEANEIRPRLEAVLTRAMRIVEDRGGPRWTHALRSIVTAAGADVELRDIHARGVSADLGACELRIEGSTKGRAARVAADRFREILQTNLERSSGGKTVVTQFERLEDESALPTTPRVEGNAAFTIVAVVASGTGATPKAERGN